MVVESIVMTNFVIVDATLHYNIILGKSWIHKLRAVHSMYHQIIKYPTAEGVMEIREY